MKRQLFSGIIAVIALIVLSEPALAVPVGGPLDAITVPATGGGTVSSSITLIEGIDYYILAKGVYVHDTNPWCQADAEWGENYPGQGWVESHSTPDPDLILGGTEYDWMGSALSAPDPIVDYLTFAQHTYSPSHMYWVHVVGKGTTLGLYIQDVDHGDNAGSLEVSIYAPEPATVLLLGLGGLGLLRRRKA